MRGNVVLISALSGSGLDEFEKAVAPRLTAGHRVRSINVSVKDGATLAWLHRAGEILYKSETDGTIAVDVRLSDTDWARFSEFKSRQP